MLKLLRSGLHSRGSIGKYFYCLLAKEIYDGIKANPWKFEFWEERFGEKKMCAVKYAPTRF